MTDVNYRPLISNEAKPRSPQALHVDSVPALFASAIDIQSGIDNLARRSTLNGILEPGQYIAIDRHHVEATGRRLAEALQVALRCQ